MHFQAVNRRARPLVHSYPSFVPMALYRKESDEEFKVDDACTPSHLVATFSETIRALGHSRSSSKINRQVQYLAYFPLSRIA